jgi:hypothetical protein
VPSPPACQPASTHQQRDTSAASSGPVAVADGLKLCYQRQALVLVCSEFFVRAWEIGFDSPPCFRENFIGNCWLNPRHLASLVKSLNGPYEHHALILPYVEFLLRFRHGLLAVFLGDSGHEMADALLAAPGLQGGVDVLAHPVQPLARIAKEDIGWFAPGGRRRVMLLPAMHQERELS